ncbi:MAG: OmpA family protein [Flavobacteriales bacterium]|nr:OmpA family protein [Flavobacteriales bacterium]
MKYLISCGLLCLLSVACIAQPYGDPKFKQKFNKADALVFDGAYLEALPLLEEMYADDSTNANLNYLLGVCYLMGSKNHTLAIRRLESATRDVSLEYQEANWKERKAPGKAYYVLGRAYHFKNLFDRAVTNYYNYRSFIEMDDVETYNQVRQQIQYAENAMELIKTPVGVKITNLGANINTKYPDYCPVVSADDRVLIFTSRREGGTGDAKDENGNYYDDIYVCSKQGDGTWSRPKSIGSNINTPGHEAAIGLSPDGQLLFIYKDDNGDGNIYYSKRSGDDWTKPEPMGSDINTSSWETHATVNATQDMLIFVSNRSDGGYGGRDLWYCKKLPNGEWGLAINMGSVINSQFEEDSPFLSANGQTLIFSSQGHTSMGGFDIFRSEFEDGSWTLPENIGYPINTAEDDVFFVLTPDGRHAYYSSRMDGGFGDTDLYKLRLEVKKTEGAAVARGIMKVPAMAYADIKAQIVVTDEGGAQVGTYHPNPTTGYYVLILKPGETYTVSYEADGYETVVSKLPVAEGEVYAEYDGVVELEEVVFGKDILAIQKETKVLEEEKAIAAAKVAEQERLAQEADAKAKKEAEELALAQEKDAERKKAEQLAAKEKDDAAAALALEEEKAKKAELDRRKAEAKAKFEAQQAQAAKQNAEEEAKLKLEAELAQKKAEEEARLQEEQNLASAKAEEVARLQEEQNVAKAKAEEEARVKEETLAKEKAEQEAAEKKTEEEASAMAKAAEEVKSEPIVELNEEVSQPQTEVVESEKSVTSEPEQGELQVVEVAQQEASQETSQQEELAEADEQAQIRKEFEAAEQKAKEEASAKVEQETVNENVVVDADGKSPSVEQTSNVETEEDNELAQQLAAAAAESEAKRLAEAELKKKELQKRIDALKAKQQEQEKQEELEIVQEPVKEVAVQKMTTQEPAAAIDADAIKAKRDAMMARIEQLKKSKVEVEKKKVVDEAAVAEASAKEKLALQKKQELVKKSDQTKEEIAALQSQLAVVEKQVITAEKEVEVAKSAVVIAQEKVASDIEEEKRIAQEALVKQQEADEAARQIKELEALEQKRIEQERLAAEQQQKEQREEAERTKRELIQLEAVAEQQRQVQAALEAEEKKKKVIEAAEKDAYSKEEILSNAATLDELRNLNRKLIQDNLDLRKELAELNRKLDLILARLDYAPDGEKVDIPMSSTMKNLQEGKRLILRNIFFDYNEAVLRSKSIHELNKLFEFLNENPGIQIQVSGHTDSRGNDDYNMRLSKDRAQAVVDYLIRNGISSKRLTAVGYGETRPIARNENADLTDNPIGRQLNRRIEISIPEGKVNGVEVEEINVPKSAQIR